MPKLSVRRSEISLIDRFLGEVCNYLTFDPYELSFISDYTITSAIKTTMFLRNWIYEYDEEYLSKKYNLGPGDIYSLVETAEWLAYSLKELSKLTTSSKRAVKDLEIIHRRIKFGVKEELLELVKPEGIGRVRARAPV